MKSIGIIGYGNVGETLAKCVYENKKFELLWICSKHFNNSNVFPDVKLFPNISQIELLPDIIFITSNDSQIKNIATILSNVFCDKLHSKIIIHTSGAFGLELLYNCRKYGAIIVAAHPFQTFFSKNISCFNDICWGIEINDNRYTNEISDLITLLSGHPFFLPQSIIDNKELYHSIGVAVSNYVAGAIKLGSLIAEQIQLPKNDFLIPIIKQTIENCLESIISGNNNFPITGPIARNDIETIEKHLNALNKFPALQQIYISFADGLKKIINIEKFTEKN